MYNMTRGLTPAKFDCDECHSDGSPYADGTDQACLWNLQQLFGYNSVFGFEDVWVIWADQCPEGYTIRDMGNLMADLTSFTDAGTKNCLVILDADSYNCDFEPVWDARYHPKMASHPKYEGFVWERNNHLYGYYYDMTRTFFGISFWNYQGAVEDSWSYKMEQENLKRETLNTFLIGKLDEMAQIITNFETNYDPSLFSSSSSGFDCSFLKEEFKNFSDEACMDFVMVNFFMFAIQLLCGIMLYLKMINEFRIGQYLEAMSSK